MMCCFQEHIYVFSAFFSAAFYPQRLSSVRVDVLDDHVKLLI